MSVSRRLVVSIDDQSLRVIEDGVCVRVFPVSTAIKGMGFTKDSYRTPTGLFRICEKTGGGFMSASPVRSGAAGISAIRPARAN